MGIGLTFDEYVDLRCYSLGGVLNNFLENLNCMFPMFKTVVPSHLRSRGYDCNTAMLDMLVENGVVKLAKPDEWTQADVDKAAEHFEQCEIYTPSAAICHTYGCRYVDFLRPLLADISHVLPSWTDFLDNRPLSSESSNNQAFSAENSHCLPFSGKCCHCRPKPSNNSNGRPALAENLNDCHCPLAKPNGCRCPLVN